MRVLGTVKDAATEVPLPGAKIRLYVREEELAAVQSDSEGKFEHISESQYIGEILICKVEKAGYEPQKVIQEFEEDEVQLEINLVPGEEEKIELTVNLKDEKRNPLKGVKVSLEVDGEGVGVGISDKDGIFKISLSPDFEGKTINYKVELGGFELATGEVQLKKETSVKITMKKPPVQPTNRKWLKIAAGAAGIVAVILVAIFILQIIPPNGPPEMPIINSFEASPSAISAGEGSTLSWSVSDATSVTIEPGIGDVALTGTMQVSPPTGTTIYALTATNDAGKRTNRVTRTLIVIVKEGEVSLPAVKYFQASPSEIKPDESSTLTWDVSDATSVTIDPEIGKVALTGTMPVSPTETTTYTLTATSDAGNRFDTVKVIVKEEEINLPVINSFQASPSEIKPDESSKLSWDVSDATSVTIDPRIGDVALIGTRQVSPTETTIYTLTATNDAGNRFDSVRVIVKEEEVNLPVISSFEASPGAISAEEGSTLSWSVSDASRVTIEPEIGSVASTGTRQASPTGTTTYTLTATNEAGSVYKEAQVVVQEKPDLVITRIWHEYTGTRFLEDTTIYYTIKNNGEGAAGASKTYMSWYPSGKLISTDNVPSLAPGQTRTASFSPYTFSETGFDINICADGNHKIAETDETNNCNRYYTLG